MDEMSMRLSELEAETEETVKQTGKLTVMQERDHAQAEILSVQADTSVEFELFHSHSSPYNNVKLS